MKHGAVWQITTMLRFLNHKGFFPSTMLISQDHPCNYCVPTGSTRPTAI